MTEKILGLGKIKMVQIQPSGLIVKSQSGDYFDPTRRVVVDRLIITPLGVEAFLEDGKQILDIHHINHPGKAYGKKDLVSIGFTSHYDAMRARFGEHMQDGIAGENIIIDYDQEVWTKDLGQKILFENQATGKHVSLDLLKYAKPCHEFSQFAANSFEKLPSEVLKSTLMFLNNGRRGFLLVLSEGQAGAVVQPGDRVFAIK